ISFTSTPDDMLTSLTRIIADRSVGALYFGNYYLMDYELMGGDARAAIIAETEKRGMKAFLPPAVPFGSKQWPTLITPGQGTTSLADLRGGAKRSSRYARPRPPQVAEWFSSDTLRRFSPMLQRARPLPAGCREQACGQSRAPKPSQPACRCRCDAPAPPESDHRCAWDL